MKLSIFTNDVLTKGAILGGVMAASKIAETAMLYYGGLDWALLILLEALIVIVLYIYLLYRFTRNYSNLVLEQRKDMPYFTYGNGLSYIVLVSMLAGVIAGLSGYLFMHFNIGYDNFVDKMVTMVQNAFVQSGVPMTPEYSQILNDLQSTSEPDFIDSILSNAWSYLIYGTVVGLILAIFTTRKPQLFNN